MGKVIKSAVIVLVVVFGGIWVYNRIQTVKQDVEQQQQQTEAQAKADAEKLIRDYQTALETDDSTFIKNFYISHSYGNCKGKVTSKRETADGNTEEYIESDGECEHFTELQLDSLAQRIILLRSLSYVKNGNQAALEQFKDQQMYDRIPYDGDKPTEKDMIRGRKKTVERILQGK